MELLGPEKVDPANVKPIKKKLFGYSTISVTKEAPFGDLGEGILFLGNLRGKRGSFFQTSESVKFELMGDKYNLFMVRNPIEGRTLRWTTVDLVSLRKEEVGHFLAAFPKKVKLSIPFFIPNITLGSFGAITQVPSMLFQGSLLLGLISRATLGYACGLTIYAFNMILWDVLMVEELYSVVCNTQSGDGDNNFDLVRTDMSAAIVDAPLSQVLRDNNVHDDGDDDGNEEELDLM
ncbi:hypothetical protein LOK49_LG12G02172 [Camellia lanceoleosa]|uniref:Uncharacterized protein n=1 Tax=Camellia lanceoleosa TaxID=1840588 RepID=A0ACC0FVX9_9ERIC|nr:hypothetical protein LOK49_LG12G02172 [Camellia lanceoleosa]